jgi:uncharacterized tellurite resistance protein B-like protein
LWENLKISSKPNADFVLNEQTAVLAILHYTMKCDDVESHEEVELLQQIVSKSPLFEENSYKQDKKLILQVKNYCNAQDISILDKALGVLSPNLQIAAIYMAIEMVFVDGKLTESEKEFIELVASKVKMDLEKVKSAIEIFSTIYMYQD